jgi:adhesin/invasin
VSLFGTGLATAATSASTLPLPARLAATEVLVNGVPAPLFFVSPLQVNFQMPFEATGSTAAIAVRVGGLVSGNATVRLANESPAIFLAPYISPAAGAALNQDSTVNTPPNPARPETVIQLFATGLGAVRPAPPTGSPAASAEPLNRAAVPVRALIEGRESEVLFAGLAPGLVAVYQVNVRLPAGLASGNVPVKILAGPAGSESNTVTISVQ